MTIVPETSFMSVCLPKVEAGWDVLEAEPPVLLVVDRGRRVEKVDCSETKQTIDIYAMCLL